MVTERRGPLPSRGPAHLRRACLAIAAALAFTPATTAWSQTSSRTQPPARAQAPARTPAPAQVQPAPAAAPLPQSQVQTPAPAPAQALPQAVPAVPAPAPTPAWLVEPMISATLLATDNSGYSDPQGEDDQVLDLTPRLRVFGRGARTELDADIGLHVLYYLQDTQRKRVLPDARADLRSTLIDRWAYFDARFVSEQTAADPLAARPDLSSSVNRITTNRLRLSPRIEHQFTPSLSLQARSDNAWTKRSGEYDPDDPRRDAFEQRHFLRLGQQTARLGLAAELQRFEASYSDDAGDVLSVDGARGVAMFGFGPQLQLGVVAGRERSRFAAFEYDDNVYGVRALWLPTERSRLRASVENRFFGTGWEAEATHRSPMWALQFRSFREPTALPESQVLSPFSTDMASLLDAILTTRHPDPAQRRRLVRSMMDSLDLPEILERPTEVYSDQAQLQTGHTASLALLGRRTTTSVSVQASRLEPLANESGAATPLPPLTPLPPGASEFLSDSKQRGVGVDVRHRLSPQLSLGLRGRVSKLEGTGATTGLDRERTEKLVRVSFSYALSPRATATAGVRRQMFDATARADARENAVFVGLSQRF